MSALDKLTTLQQQLSTLQEQQAKALQERREEIGALAEAAGVLTVPNAVLLGLFRELRELPDSAPRLAELAEKGQDLAKPKRGRPAGTGTSKQAAKGGSNEPATAGTETQE